MQADLQNGDRQVPEATMAEAASAASQATAKDTLAADSTHHSSSVPEGLPDGDPDGGHDSGPYGSPDSSNDEIIGRAFRWSLAVIGVLACGVAGLVLWLRSGGVAEADRRISTTSADRRAQAMAQIPHVPFTDMTKAAGVDFVHVNGRDVEMLFPEFMGAGVVLFDYNGDGRLDILFTNGQYWPWAIRNKLPPGKNQPNALALYRNDGNWHFTEVTQEAGLIGSYYAMGAAAADLDNDGDQDLFVAAVGPNHLYRNDGGRFVEITEQAGVAGAPDAFSTGCGWFDYDRDGDLDLVVLNYIVWSREINNQTLMRMDNGQRYNIRPQVFEGASSYMYRNEGGGFFSDVSGTCGIRVMGRNTGKPLGKSLGFRVTDFDGDRWLDFVVANDTDRNFAFVNQRNGTFREVAEHLGIAYGPSGRARSGMGIDINDFRNNGTLGIPIGNFSGEMCALFASTYKPDSKPRPDQIRFSDQAIACGIGAESKSSLTFGLFNFDVDFDGRLDLFLCNGHVDPSIEEAEPGQSYAQPPLLFWNCGQQGPCEYLPMKAEHVGKDLLEPIVGRGAAYGDLDGDGDLDIVLTSTGGPVRLLRNDQKLGNHYLRFKLVGKRSDRDAVGALIEVKAGGRTMQQRVSPVRSYFSQCESEVTFGLGRDTQVDSVRIVWPRGNEQLVHSVKADCLTIVQEEIDGER
jgi:hypothetical protein